MKPHERRAACAYPYYKLATWNTLSMTWQDGKKAFDSEGAARMTAYLIQPVGTRCRVSEVTEGGRRDLEPFVVS